jgi:hypothetical protein
MFIKKYSSAISFLIIAVTIYFSFSALMPNNISDLSTPLTDFSTQRALVQLKEISKKAHYVGSENHNHVRNYIVEQLRQLGLEVEIQNQIAVNKKWRAGANTHNIIAKVKGSDNTKALMLLTHYDSNPHSSLGASDAGSGVVTILEALRAFLKANDQPKNDIIILITDAEELGLLGASAFVNNHPWAKEVGLVLNFEARGSGGPSYMLMETNGGNKKLVEHFNKANPKFPVASSLMYSLYKLLPNDTDLTIFREDGNIEGFNFAFIGDHFDYHTALDNFERLDRETLEHQGTYLMPLLQYFAETDLNDLKSETDDVYFNFPKIGLVYYPFSWILPLLIVLIVIFLGLTFRGLAKRKINMSQVLKGLIPFFLTLFLTVGIAHFGWKILLRLYPQYNDILQGFTYNGYLYIAAFSSLTVSIAFIIYAKYFDELKTINLAIAPIVTWILINIIIAIFLKGAGYFIIAALYGLIYLTVALYSKKSMKSKRFVFTLLFIPIIIIFVPWVKLFPVGLGLKMMSISAALIVLLFGLLIPVLSYFKKSKNLGILFFILSLIIFVSASFKSDYNLKRKKPNSIIYVLDADKNEAYWASYNANVDEFTRQFLGDAPVRGQLDSSTTASKYATKIALYKKAEVKDIPQPEIIIDLDTVINDNRYLSITIKPKRRINRIEIASNNNISFTSFVVNGIHLPKKNNEAFVFKTNANSKQVLSYFITEPNEKLNIRFSVPIDQKLGFTVYESSYDLLKSPIFNMQPLYQIKPRSETMIPMPFVINDAIIVKKRIDLK